MRRFICSGLLTLTFITIHSGVEPQEYQRKVNAAILNAAIGDALGRITEFVDSTNAIYERFGSNGVTRLSQAANIVHPITKKVIAPYTDDTVMSLIVLETVQDGRKNNVSLYQMMDSLARKFAEIFGSTKHVVDPLYNVRAHGLRNIKAGKELNSLIAGHNDQEIGWFENRPQQDIPTEAGCGSVMRAWPIGLIYADDLPLAFALADAQSRLTHRHPMARAASVAIAIGVAKACQNKTVDEIVEGRIEAAERFDQEELQYKINAKKLLPSQLPTQEMIAHDRLLTSDMIRYAYHAAQTGKTPREVLGNRNTMHSANHRSIDGFLLGWAADEAVAAAVYLFVRHHADPQQAIIEGVNTPGDSDSIASLAGALVGAKTGIVYNDSLAALENVEYLSSRILSD